MVKVTDITQEQFDGFIKAPNQVNCFKGLVGIDKKDKTSRGVGDTCIQVFNSKMLEVYKDEYHGRVIYYIIAETITDTLAFAYSLYENRR